MSTNQQEDEMVLQGYKAWKAIWVGGTSHTWAGYISALTAEKTMAYGRDESQTEILQSCERNRWIGEESWPCFSRQEGFRLVDVSFSRPSLSKASRYAWKRNMSRVLIGYSRLSPQIYLLHFWILRLCRISLSLRKDEWFRSRSRALSFRRQSLEESFLGIYLLRVLRLRPLTAVF